MPDGGGATFRVRLVAAESAPFSAGDVSPQHADSPIVELTDADGVSWGQEYEAAERLCVCVPGLAVFVRANQTGEICVFPVEGASEAAIHKILGRGVAPLFAHRSGLEVLHASAVELPAGIVAFGGAPRSGKSTIAYGFAARRRRQWSDDALAIDAAVTPVSVVPLPFSPRLRSDSAALFRSRRCDPLDLDVARMSSGCRPLAALFLLRPACEQPYGGTHLESLSGAEAFIQALNSSLFYEDATADRHDLTIRHFLGLAASVPVVRIVFPSKLDEVGAVLDSIEQAAQLLGE